VFLDQGPDIGERVEFHVAVKAERQLDPQPVPAPFLDLVEVAAVGVDPVRRFPAVGKPSFWEQ
jgi:hypothetical protein